MDRLWTKLGLRVAAAGSGLQCSHAMLPTPIHLGSHIRVFYASCDVHLRGRIFFADLSPTPPYQVIRLENRPVLDLGVESDFDCDGVNPSQIIRQGNNLLLYYIGWKRRSAKIPYTLIAGAARSDDEGLTFEKLGSILPLSEAEPYFRTAPFIYRDGNGWSALYIGGGRFINGPGSKLLPIYSLRRSHSSDGLNWPDSGEELLSPDLNEGEIGFGRPVLWHDSAESQRLVLSRRTVSGYSLVQAGWPIRGAGPVLFERLIDLGPEAWDSEMLCFGSFCRAEHHELMFYNGNQFGRTGFGVAARDLPSGLITEAVV